MNDKFYENLLEGILSGKMSEIQAERLLNAIARANSDTPTGGKKDQ